MAKTSHSGPGDVPHTQVHGYLRRVLENAQDALVIVLMLLLLAMTAHTLWRIGVALVMSRDTPVALVSEIVFVLLLGELYRTLIVYLREHRVSVALMVEVAIVSILREVILSSGRAFELAHAGAIALVLAVLGALLALERLRPGAAHRMSEMSAH